MDLIEALRGKGIGYKPFKTDPASLQKFMRKMEVMYAAIVSAPTVQDQLVNNGEIVTNEGEVVMHTPLYKNYP